MLVQQWLTSLQNQLRSRFARSPRGRRQQDRRLKTPSAQALVSRNVIETLEDRTLLTAFTVVNTDDSGEGSLRAAIEAANANAGADTISFDAALSGETIVLSDELLISDDLTITGLGANLLTLDGNNNSRIFNIDDDSNVSTIMVEINGLTLTNGNSNTVDTELADNGGAIFSTENLTIENCIFTGNTAGSGGAIYDDASSLTVRGSQFIGNTAEESDGGAIYHKETFPYPEDGELLLIENSQFAGNHALFSGGAVLLRDGICIVNGSTFTENTAEFPGGALRNIFGDLTVNDSSFIENYTDFSGGAIANGGTLFVSGSTFDRNTADVNGGGIYSQGAESVTIHNSTFSGNSSVFDGGGIFVLGSKPVSIINSTIVGNVAAGSGISKGGGIYLFGTDPTLIMNTIIAGNQADSGQQIDGDFTGTANIIQESITGLLDPELKDNGGPTKTHALLSDSAAINAGDNIAATNAGLTTDQRGTGFSRIVSGIIDIGAFESSVVVPVDLVVSTTSDLVDGNYSAGQLSLREAISLANTTSGADTISFDAALAGQTITLTDELLILDDLTITGLGADQLTISGDNNTRIFKIDYGFSVTKITVEIEGLTLTNGNSNESGTSTTGYGGAILNQGYLTVKNSTLRGNRARLGGGAIYSKYGSLTIENSFITENTGVIHGGGGVYVAGSGGTDLIVRESTFSFNTTGLRGGAIFISAGNSSILNSTFSENTAVDSGGGVYNNSSGSMTIDASTFVKNVTSGNGGAILNSGELLVANSTISENSALDLGAGISSSTTATFEIVNSTIVLNYTRSALSRGAAIYGSNSNSFSIKNSIIAENSSGQSVQISGLYEDQNNIILDSIDGLIDPVLGDNGGDTETHALLPGSAAINAGDNSFSTHAGLITDQRGAGFPRVFNETVDIGAVEFQTAYLLVDTTSDLNDGIYSAGNLSLREAIELANAFSAVDTISFANALAGQTITLSDELLITDDVTIIGLEADQLTLDGNGNSRIFTIDDGSSATEIAVSISGLTLTNGSGDNGGAILNRENLTLQDSLLTGNTASLDGGGIYHADATLTISNTAFTLNHSDNNGGALANSAEMVLQNSTLSGNSTLHLGGGIYSGSTATLEVLNSTLVLNEATSDVSMGGAIYSSATNPFEIKNSIIAGNTAVGSPQISGGYNASFSIVQDSITGLIDPVLKDNGGPTQTHALLTGSAAIDAGDNSLAETAGLATDQRGSGFPRIYNGAIDIGAVEFYESDFVVDTISDLDDGDYSAGKLSLREAIQLANASSTADTILFDDSLAGQTIYLTSELLITADLTIVGLGVDQLTLDAGNNSRLFHINDGDDTKTFTVEIDGLTLANGSTLSTGGAILTHENLIVSNSTLSGSYARLGGGAIFSTHASLTIENSLITGNASLFQGGGGVMYFRSGGTGFTVNESTFSHNTTDGDGAAVYFFEGDASVRNSTFDENTAEDNGGAIQNNYSGFMTVDSSTFYKNRSNYSGGALANDNELFVVNSTLSENSADYLGGGIYTYRNTTLEIVNSTIVMNHATSYRSSGGGIYSTKPNVIHLANTIVAGNTAINNVQIDSGYTETASIITDSLTGLIDPVLRDNGGPTKTHALLTGSAALNAGDNTAASNAGLTTDQRGTGFARILDDIVDIGAFEGRSDIFTVDTISDIDDGDYSVGNLSLREAIKLANAASTTDTIFFDASLAGQTITLGSELTITDDLIITGLGADQLTISGNNNSRIFNINIDDITVEITGLTLTKGAGIIGGAIHNVATLIVRDSVLTENTASQYGAGIYSTQGDVTLTNSIVMDNHADRGAGVYSLSGVMTFDSNTFSGNVATRDGAGIYYTNFAQEVTTPSTIHNTEFTDNIAGDSGGGFHSSRGIFIVTNSTFSRNAAELGGGIYASGNEVGGSVTVIDSTFSDQTQVKSGGGIYNNGSAMSVENSHFTGNAAIGENTMGLGGGIYITGGSLTVTGTEFSENVASRGGGGIYSGGNEFLTISASTFNKNQSRSGGGIFNNNTTLSILDSRFTENQALVTPGKEYLTAAGGAVFNSYAVATAAGEMDTLIANTEFTGNYADNTGAAIQQSFGFITISNSLITENLVGTSGSGIHNSFGQMTVHQSTISNNKSLGNGSGISNNGTLLLSESTVAGNIATYFGGGVYISSGGTTTISNSTLSGNQSASDGGALYANTNQPLSIINTTITGNSAGRGGGIRAVNVIPALTNSIIAGNTADLEPQLYSTYTNVNSIVQDSIAGLLDPVLRDNGGPTKTHALLPGSAAIDAGDNAAATAAGLITDQRGEGSSRIIGGSVDIGAFEVQAPFAQVDLRIVDSKTSTTANGEVNELPANREWIDEWGGYWLEIWISSPLATSQGIASVNLNLSYNTAVTTAVAIEYGAAFTIGQVGTINDLTGVIENLSAGTSLSDVGDDQPVLFARIRFESEFADAVALDFEGQTLNPQSPSILVDSSEILFTGSADSEEVNGPAPETTIYANPFDLNDDDLINYRDLMLFIRAFGTTPGQSSNHYAWAADYNQNGRVDFPDLLAMVYNFGKSKEGAIPIDYPANFPEAWNQLLTVETQQPLQTTAKSVTQAAAETMLESAKAELSPQLDSERQQLLSEVDVQVVDLADDTLGRAFPGTIYIDVNAAGYGWFVDATPADSSEFSSASELSLIALPDSEAAGHVDLWTVILHELGHLLGYEHAADGVMQESLAPGERRLVDWESETDAFFGTLTDDAELSVF
ncbi:choice-of-anchor Q domain-containing protein [Gimesia sp.]|uniref:choice-of-anchor Q domain-containing protein n=1 Tax=Gimesia sp. TaxID=2024833 RepID=UPI003A8ED812